MLMLGEAQGIVSLDTNRLDAGVAHAMGSLSALDGAGRGLGGGLDRLDNKLRTVGMSTTSLGVGFLGLGATMLTPIAAGVKGMMDFESQMDAVASALGTTSDAIKPLQEQIMQIGADGQYSANEMAMVTEELAKAGYSIQAIMGDAKDGSQSMTKAVSDLASATGTSLPQSVNAITTAMATWSKDLVGDRVDYRGVPVAMTDASMAADVLTVAANASKASIEDLQGGMKNFGPQAALFGVSFQDAAASIALFSNYGLVGREAGTSLSRALVMLSDPTSEAAGLMQELGIEAFDASGKFKGMPSLLDQLNKSMAHLDDKTRLANLSKIFGQDAMDVMGIGILTGSKLWEDIRVQMDESGIAAEQAAQRVDNLKGAVQRMFEGIQNLLMKMASGVIKPLTMLASGIDKVVGLISKMPAPILAAIGVLITLAGLAALASGAFLLMAPRIIAGVNALRGLAGTGGAIGAAATNLLRLGNAASFAGRMLMFLLRLTPLIGLGILAYNTNFLGFGDWIQEQVGRAEAAWDRFKSIWGGTEMSENTYGPGTEFAFKQVAGDGPDGYDYMIVDENGNEIGKQLESWWGEDGRIHAKVELENGEVVEMIYGEDNKTPVVQTEIKVKNGTKELSKLERFNKGMDTMQEWMDQNGLGFATPLVDGIQNVVNKGAGWLSSARGLGQWYDRFQGAFEGTRGIPGMDLWDRINSAWNVSTQGMTGAWIERGERFVDAFSRVWDNTGDMRAGPRILYGLAEAAREFGHPAIAKGLTRMGVGLDAGLKAVDNFTSGFSAAWRNTGEFGTVPRMLFSLAEGIRRVGWQTGAVKLAQAGAYIDDFTESLKANYDVMGKSAMLDGGGTGPMNRFQKAYTSLAMTLDEFGFEGASANVLKFGGAINRAYENVRKFIDGLDTWTLKLDRPDIAALGTRGRSWLDSVLNDSLEGNAVRLKNWVLDVGTPIIMGLGGIAEKVMQFVGGIVAGVALTAWDIILGRPTVLFGWGGTSEDSETGLDTLLEDIFGKTVEFTVNAVLDLGLSFLGNPAENMRNTLLGALVAGLGIMAVTAGITPVLILASIVGLGLLGVTVFNAIKDYFKEHPEAVAQIQLKVSTIWDRMKSLERVGWVFQWAETAYNAVSTVVGGFLNLRRTLIDLGGPFEWLVRRFEKLLVLAGGLNVLSKIGSGYFKGTTKNEFMWRYALQGLWELAKFPFRMIFRPMQTLRSIFSRIAVNQLYQILDPDTGKLTGIAVREAQVAIRSYRSIFGSLLKYMGKATWAFIRGPFDVFGRAKLPFLATMERYRKLWAKASTKDVWFDFPKMNKNGQVVGRYMETVALSAGDIKKTKIGRFFYSLNETMRRSRTPLRFVGMGFNGIGAAIRKLWAHDALVERLFGKTFKARLQTAHRALINFENAPWASIQRNFGNFLRFFGRGAPIYGPLPPNQMARFLYNLRVIRTSMATNLTRMSTQALAQGNFMRSRVLSAYAYFFNGFQWRNRRFITSMRQLYRILNPKYFGPPQKVFGPLDFIITALRTSGPAFRSAFAVLGNTSVGNFIRTFFHPRQWNMLGAQVNHLWRTISGSMFAAANRWLVRRGGNFRVAQSMANQINRMVARMVPTGRSTAMQGPMMRYLTGVIPTGVGFAKRMAALMAQPLRTAMRLFFRQASKGPFGRNIPIVHPMMAPGAWAFDNTRLAQLLKRSKIGERVADLLRIEFRGVGRIVDWTGLFLAGQTRGIGRIGQMIRYFLAYFVRGMDRLFLTPLLRWSTRTLGPRFVRLLFLPLINAFRVVAFPFRAITASFRGLGSLISRFVTGPFDTLAKGLSKVVPWLDNFGRLGPRVAAGMLLASAATVIWKSNIFGVQEAFGGVFAGIGRGWRAVKKGFDEGGMAGAMDVIITGFENAIKNWPATLAGVLESPAWNKVLTGAGYLAGIRMGGPMGLALAFMGPAIARMGIRFIAAGGRIARAWEEGGPVNALRQLRVEMLAGAEAAGKWFTDTGQGMIRLGKQLRRIPVVGDFLGNIFEKAGANFVEFGSKLKRATSLYRKFREKGMSPLNAALLSLGLAFPGFNKLLAKGTALWTKWRRAMKPSINALKGVWKQVKELRGPLGQILGSFGKLLGGDFAGFWDDFSGGVRKLIPELADVGSAIMRFGIVQLYQWRAASRALFNQLKEDFPSLAGHFDTLGSGVDDVLQGVQSLWRGIDRILQGDFEGGWEWIQTGLAQIWEGLGGVWDGVVGLLSEVDWSAVGTAIENAILAVPWAEIGSSIATAIQNFPWSDAFSGLRTAATEIFTWLKNLGAEEGGYDPRSPDGTPGTEVGGIAPTPALIGDNAVFQIIETTVNGIATAFNLAAAAIERFQRGWEWVKQNIPGAEGPMQNAETRADGFAGALGDLGDSLLVIMGTSAVLGFLKGGLPGALRGLVGPLKALGGPAKFLLGLGWAGFSAAMKGLGKIGWWAIKLGFDGIAAALKNFPKVVPGGLKDLAKSLPKGLGGRFLLVAIGIAGVEAAMDQWDKEYGIVGLIKDIIYSLDDLYDKLLDVTFAMAEFIGLTDPGHNGPSDPATNLSAEALDDTQRKIRELYEREGMDFFVRIHMVTDTGQLYLPGIGKFDTAEEAYQAVLKIIPELTPQEWNDAMPDEWDIDLAVGNASALEAKIKNIMQNGASGGIQGILSSLGQGVGNAVRNMVPSAAVGPSTPTAGKGQQMPAIVAPTVSQETRDLYLKLAQDWQADTRTQMPVVVREVQRPTHQLPALLRAPITAAAGVFSTGFAGIAGTVTGQMVATRMGAVTNTTGMATGVSGAATGMAGRVTGSVAGMAGGVAGSAAGMAGSAIGSAMAMGGGMTSGAQMGAAGVAGGMAGASVAVLANSGRWPGIIYGVGGMMAGAGASAGAAAGFGVARGLDSAHGAVQAAAYRIVDTVNAALAAAAKISSPSRLMADEVGIPLVQGIAAGMTGFVARHALIGASFRTINTVDTGLRREAGIASPAKRFQWHGLMSTMGLAKGLQGTRSQRTLSQATSQVMGTLARGLQPEDTDIGWFNQRADEWRSRQTRNRPSAVARQSTGGGATYIDQSTHRTMTGTTFDIKSTDPIGVQREVVTLLDEAWGDV